jgi:hypothetical protein
MFLVMKTKSTTETSVNQTTRRNAPEDNHLHGNVSVVSFSKFEMCKQRFHILFHVTITELYLVMWHITFVMESVCLAISFHTPLSGKFCMDGCGDMRRTVD